MVAVLAAALFTTIALLGTALFALLAQLHGFRGEVQREFLTLRSDLARIEQKLDDHIASPHPAR
jgi:hypothetical protein